VCNLHRGQPVHIHPWSSEPKRVPFGAAQFTIARTGCAAIMLASSGSPSSGTHALWSARHAPGVSDVPRLTLWRVLAYASTSHLPGEGVDRGQPTRLDSSTACSRGAFNNDALPRANVETRAGSSRRRCSTVQQPKQQQEKKQRWQRSRPEGCCTDNDADDAETKSPFESRPLFTRSQHDE
jgi:hypothetical protein